MLQMFPYFLLSVLVCVCVLWQSSKWLDLGQLSRCNKVSISTATGRLLPTFEANVMKASFFISLRKGGCFFDRGVFSSALRREGMMPPTYDAYSDRAISISKGIKVGRAADESQISSGGPDKLKWGERASISPCTCSNLSSSPTECARNMLHRSIVARGRAASRGGK